MIRQLTRTLEQVYDHEESCTIARIIACEATGWSVAKILCGDARLEDSPKAQEMLQRALKSEPIQYITGWTMFCGHKIKCDRRALIPRPETEQMVEWIMSREEKGLQVMDLCTGSGCIAVAMGEEWQVSALEKSEKALALANENFLANNVKIDLTEDDIFSPSGDYGVYDIIISNPPYIKPSERVKMEANVLEYEPEMALFATEEQPLMFYQAIAMFGREHLKEGGRFYVEVNSALAEETAELFRRLLYNNVSVRQDQFGKARFVWGER